MVLLIHFNPIVFLRACPSIQRGAGGIVGIACPDLASGSFGWTSVFPPHFLAQKLSFLPFFGAMFTIKLQHDQKEQAVDDRKAVLHKNDFLEK
jgi:hypothetical protein